MYTLDSYASNDCEGVAEYPSPPTLSRPRTPNSSGNTPFSTASNTPPFFTPPSSRFERVSFDAVAAPSPASTPLCLNVHALGTDSSATSKATHSSKAAIANAADGLSVAKVEVKAAGRGGLVGVFIGHVAAIAVALSVVSAAKLCLCGVWGSLLEKWTADEADVTVVVVGVVWMASFTVLSALLGGHMLFLTVTRPMPAPHGSIWPCWSKLFFVGCGGAVFSLFWALCYGLFSVNVMEESMVLHYAWLIVGLMLSLLLLGSSVAKLLERMLIRKMVQAAALLPTNHQPSPERVKSAAEIIRAERRRYVFGWRAIILPLFATGSLLIPRVVHWSSEGQSVTVAAAGSVNAFGGGGLLVALAACFLLFVEMIAFDYGPIWLPKPISDFILERLPGIRGDSEAINASLTLVLAPILGLASPYAPFVFVAWLFARWSVRQLIKRAAPRYDAPDGETHVGLFPWCILLAPVFASAGWLLASKDHGEIYFMCAVICLVCSLTVLLIASGVSVIVMAKRPYDPHSGESTNATRQTRTDSLVVSSTTVTYSPGASATPTPKTDDYMTPHGRLGTSMMHRLHTAPHEYAHPPSMLSSPPSLGSCKCGSTHNQGPPAACNGALSSVSSPLSALSMLEKGRWTPAVSVLIEGKNESHADDDDPDFCQDNEQESVGVGVSVCSSYGGGDHKHDAVKSSCHDEKESVYYGHGVAKTNGTGTSERESSVAVSCAGTNGHQTAGREGGFSLPSISCGDFLDPADIHRKHFSETDSYQQLSMMSEEEEDLVRPSSFAWCCGCGVKSHSVGVNTTGDMWPFIASEGGSLRSFHHRLAGLISSSGDGSVEYPHSDYDGTPRPPHMRMSEVLLDPPAPFIRGKDERRSLLSPR
ncbi:unnamed protein product [Vitrella brassicaformis CCMP3155]|uniref:Transmembrane protein n=2 Tax=Vitrella brassicaformis TaxID=1169539 RepID=A0A0G4ENK4_VITBC|nr:unnamed protein product [Vitrella brassicaformis CCMP3155]|eukprot:CEL98559.1 unnamed protein product [Vitrella brassicaformis CCMP3155]